MIVSDDPESITKRCLTNHKNMYWKFDVLNKRIPSMIIGEVVLGLLLITAITSCRMPGRDFLTSEERAWLQQHEGELETLAGYNDPPYGYYDVDGQYIGIVMDHLKEIEDQLGIRFVARNFETWDELIEYSKTGRNFILLGIARTDSRVEYLSFTDPLIKEIYVFVTEKNNTSTTMNDLVSSKVCSTANYAVNEYIARYFPQISLELFPDSLSGVRAVSTGDCDAMVISQLSASYLIDSQGIGNLKIAGESGYVNRLGAAISINDPMLFNIVDKAVDRIPPERQQAIYRKWVNTGSPGIPKSIIVTVAVVIGLSLILLTTFALWSMSLQRQVRKQTMQIRASEEKFRSYVEHAPGGIFVADEKGNHVESNEAAARITGYSQYELLNMNLIELIAPEDHQKARKHYETLLKTGKATDDLSFIKKDGSLNYWTVAAVKLSDNRLLGFVTDITDRKRIEAERLKLSKLESVGVLAGGIAHDFNNVLTGLFGNIEMAKVFLPPTHKAHKFLESAMRSMERATHLTKQLLTFARGGDPIREILSIGGVITETAQFSTRGSNVKLKIDIASNLWPVEADKGQLSQVISNLVLNAQQAMPTGGVITIIAKNIETSEGRFVQISIHDEGLGIPPQYVDKIFDPYFTTKQHGSGLGLAIIQSIISKHNGTIAVDSELNQGATFTIRLPATKKSDAIVVTNKLSDRPAAMPVSVAHILVLDDEKAVRDVLTAMLEALGHNVSHAVDGQEAIEKYQQAYLNGSAYDAVITDLTIPGGMGGQMAAKEIFSIDPAAQIIVSSGYATDPVMANYKEYGFKARIVKPYRFEEIQNVTQQVLKNRTDQATG